MKLPYFLTSFRNEAEALLRDGKIGHIEYSGPTYQIQVLDPKASNSEGYWSFLQLGARGQMLDYFCTCQEHEEEGGCSHLAAAHMRIYNDENTPLHLRFQDSLWNTLCRYYMEKIGSGPEVLTKKEDGVYLCESAGDEPLCLLKAKGAEAKEQLDAVILHREKETEETSLKFSNLSEDELKLWREGHPPPELLYELSFWNDIAKWLMRLQEEDPSLHIAFEYSKKMVPNRIAVTFKVLHVEFAIPAELLPLLVPSLTTVASPLKVYRTQTDAISTIRYDAKTGRIHIIPKALSSSQEEIQKKGKVLLNGWSFIPGKGFYSLQGHELLLRPVVEPEEVFNLLQKNFHTVEQMAENFSLHHNPVNLSYKLAFDDEWNLHITAYLFKLGDLSRPESRFLGRSPCVYLEDDGFYFLEARRFENVETIIERDDVSNFVTENRTWLSLQEGFETHLISLEAEMSYEINEQGRLIFTRHLRVGEDAENECCDFGSWIYLEEQGFFSKTHSTAGLSVRPGTAIRYDQIPVFIRTHRHELVYVSGFFSEECPVEAAKLVIEMVGNGEVKVTPRYRFRSAYRDRAVHFFDDITYVKGEGFYELPLSLRLPEEFREPIILKGKKLYRFLKGGLQDLASYIDELDPRLMRINPKELIADKVAAVGGAERGSYSLELAYAFEGGGLVSLGALWTALHKRNEFLVTDSGFVDLMDSRYEWIKAIDPDRFDLKNNTLKAGAMQVLQLDAFDPIMMGASHGGEESHRLLQGLRSFEAQEVPPFPKLKSHLRNYQIEGLRWLWFLYENGLSGLLCDDMGLGKTHQAMALIAALEEAGALEKRVLIICPTSVIYHWEEKLAQFLPDLDYFTYHGVDRNLGALEPRHKVFLTSFGIWRNEVEHLKENLFSLAIFDEIQIAKNHRSRTHSALRQVNASMRLGMTGTPIENDLRELKSLFDIVIPGYMPGEQRYREFFVKPIERFSDKDRRLFLHRYVKPFILRRKKETVLSDLPAKIEEIAHCGLSTEQFDLYNKVLAQNRRMIFEEIEEGQAPIPYIHIFALLSNLKQICNHPALYHKDPDQYEKYESGKWDLFEELLNEARDSSQKVVVFTQYLQMLDIFELYMKSKGIGYATVRGATIKRGEQISRFNNDPTCEVFLGSLQAVGLGVDLTAGSVVIHYDRWWNAARENQATDRVHRIGQQRGVQVFKLVTKNTFEERIDNLIMKKGRLMEDVVGIDDHNFVKKFDRDELIELLQYVERGLI